LHSLLLRGIISRRLKDIIKLRRLKDTINLHPHKRIINLRQLKGIISRLRKDIINLRPHKDTTNPTTRRLGRDHHLRHLGTCPLLISRIRC
jgi:hypothetical protein